MQSPWQIAVAKTDAATFVAMTASKHAKRITMNRDQAFTAPEVRPWMNSRCMNAKSRSNGRIATSVPAI